jgi:hypothetical protein
LDNPVEAPTGGECDHLASRLSRVEGDVHDLKNILVEPKIMVARIEAQIPYPATKAEIAGLEVKLGDKIAGLEVKLADKPGKPYMWGILAALLIPSRIMSDTRPAPIPLCRPPGA